MKIKNKVFAITIGLAGALSLGLPPAASATTLRQVIVHTLQTNPDILLDADIRQASKMSVRNSQAGFLPKVDLAAGIGREETKNLTTGFTNLTLTPQEIGVVLDQMVFDGFATTNNVARNKAKTNADAFRVWGTADNTALLTTEAYLNVIRDRRIVMIARQNVMAIRRVFGLVKERSLSGLGRRADISQATSRLALARANLYSAKNNLRDAVTTFHKITGMFPKNLRMPRQVPYRMLPPTLRVATHDTVAYNPFIHSADADIAEAVHQFRFTQSPFMPRLDVVLGLDRRRNIDGSRGPSNNSAAMLRLSYNLYRGGGDIAAEQEAAFQVEQAKDIKARTIREAVERIRLAWADWRTSIVRLPQLRTYRYASAKTVIAYREQFMLGKRTLLDLLDSENELFSARIQYVTEKFQQMTSKFRILNSMGVLLTSYQIPLPSEARIPYREWYNKVPIIAQVGGQASSTEPPRPLTEDYSAAMPRYQIQRGTLNRRTYAKLKRQNAKAVYTARRDMKQWDNQSNQYARGTQQQTAPQNQNNNPTQTRAAAANMSAPGALQLPMPT